MSTSSSRKLGLVWLICASFGLQPLKLIADEPGPRVEHSVVWTGTEMIVWGGRGSNGVLNTGGRYNLVTESWMAIPTAGAPSPRQNHTAVWTGTEMIVFGGFDYASGLYYLDGARFNPISNTWTALPTAGAPSTRAGHRAIWNGSEMVVWGGFSNSVSIGEAYLNTGGRFSPGSGAWLSAVATKGAPLRRAGHTMVAAGSSIVVWGGVVDDLRNDPFKDNSGGRYSVASGDWTATSVNGAPTNRTEHTAVWTGSEMIVWGGLGNGSVDFLNNGGRYNPSNNQWTAVTTNGAPGVRHLHTAVWTGSEMIVWGGRAGGTFRNNGGRFRPSSNSWAATTNAGVPVARSGHTAVWTGSEMIVWGGENATGLLRGLGRYDPVLNRWKLPAPTYAISGRVTEGGVGLAGVSLAAGAVSALSDSLGNYQIPGLTNGSYAVTAQLAGYTFSPTSQVVSISSSNSGGWNFLATKIVYPTVTISATSPDATESGVQTGALTVNRSGAPTTDPLVVNYSVSGTAAPGADYSVLAGSVTIPAGAGSAAIAVSALQDFESECAESVVVTLSTGPSYVLGEATSASVGIVDDDPPVVTIIASLANTREGSGTPGQFRIARTGCLTAPLTVHFAVGGTAAAGDDFATVGSAVTIPAGSGFAVVAVVPVDDPDPEDGETVVATLVADPDYIIGSPQEASVVIADNDTNIAPVVSAGGDQIVSVLGTARLQGSVEDDGLPVGGSLSLEWVKVSGPGTSLADDPHYAQTTVCFSTPGTYAFRLTAHDGQFSSSDDVAITVTETDPARVVNAINAGGPAYTSGGGVIYGNDDWFTDGSAASHGLATVAATADSPLYQADRSGSNFNYQIPLPGGTNTYIVALKFAELSAASAGQRVFDVSVNGALALDDFDILAASGTNQTAIDVVFPWTVSGDTLNLSFASAASSTLPALVSAIVIGSSNVVPMPAPGGLAAAAVSENQVELSWTDRSTGENGFGVERSGDGSSFAQIALLGANATAYSDSTAAPGFTYWYRVRALGTVNSAYSANASVSMPGIPAAPTSLTAVAQAGLTVRLAWADNSANEDGFVVEQSTSATRGWKQVASVGAGVTTYTAGGLSSGKTYYFRLRAHNAHGLSDYSNIASAKAIR